MENRLGAGDVRNRQISSCPTKVPFNFWINSDSLESYSALKYYFKRRGFWTRNTQHFYLFFSIRLFEKVLCSKGIFRLVQFYEGIQHHSPGKCWKTKREDSVWLFRVLSRFSSVKHLDRIHVRYFSTDWPNSMKDTKHDQFWAVLAR